MDEVEDLRRQLKEAVVTNKQLNATNMELQQKLAAQPSPAQTQPQSNPQSQVPLPVPVPVPIATFKPQKPPQHDGKNLRADARLFQVEQYMYNTGLPCNTQQSALFTASFFTGAAQDWWHYVSKAIRDGGKADIHSWDTFYLAFLKGFTPVDESRIARDELDNLKQTGPAEKYVKLVREIFKSRQALKLNLKFQAFGLWCAF